VNAPLIVCVDDDPTVTRTILRTLRHEKLSPMGTTEPEQALSWVLEHDVAVLVSDYNMPSMTGVELAARVRQLRPATVRILVTGNLDVSTALASINQGEVFRFVAKPFRPEEVARAIRDGVEQHRALAHAAKQERVLRERAALEARYPTFTQPARAHDGAYIVSPLASDSLAGLGLDELLALRR
jgi:DNA-binding NtrC family response regulator